MAHTAAARSRSTLNTTHVVHGDQMGVLVEKADPGMPQRILSLELRCMSMKPLPAASLLLLTFASPVLAQPVVDDMVPMANCGPLNAPVSFTTTGVYNAGNVFTVELSDAVGAFAVPLVIGSAAGTGSGTIACSFPAGIVGGSGQAIRILASDPAEIGEAYVLPITTAIPANAGLNSVVTVCSSDAPMELVGLLAGTPDLGGSWTGPMGPMNGAFDPATDPPGPYMYMVDAVPPCMQATATLLVTVVNAPDAGIGATVPVCGSDAPFALLDLLGGAPHVGGMWASLDGAPHPGVFQPAIDPAGCYMYTVAGMSPCANAAEAVCITVEQPANAGTGSTLAWCQSWGMLDLFAQLGGSPDAGGSWADLLGTGQLSGGMWNPTGMPNGSYAFTYTVGGGACAPSMATVTVNHAQACLAPPPNLVTY